MKHQVEVVYCGECWKWMTDWCAVAWKDGDDSWVGSGDHDDFCPYGELPEDKDKSQFPWEQTG